MSISLMGNKELIPEWHEPKRQSTLHNRCLDFAMAREVFADPNVKEYAEAELVAEISKLPYGKDDWTEEDLKAGKVYPLGTGHDTAVEYFKNPGGRSRVQDKKVLLTLRMTESKLMAYKAKAGRGWQTKLRNYIEQAISAGLL